MSTATLAHTAASPARNLQAHFETARRFTESLCEPLAIEDYVVQTLAEASPVKWHLAHATWFFERFVLAEFDPRHAPFHPRYDYLFNSYYNAVGPMHCRPNRGLLSRPTVAEVGDYRHAIDQRIADLLARSDAATLSAIAPRMTLGIHHEQQHQELMVADIKHLLSSNPLLPAYRENPSAPGTPPGADLTASAQWVEFTGGVREIGCDTRDFTFCYDNETPRHKVYLQDFRLASRPVTNAQYLRFIDDGGYSRPELWLSLGWTVVQQEKWAHPIYWYRGDDARWMHYTLAGPQPIDPDEPICHLSYFEADAFARWSGARLPTEAEWEIAARDMPIDGNFADTGPLHPQPAASPAPTDPAPRALFGDVWEWTQSPYTPYPGYRTPSGALGEYNGKFMCNQFVLRGGSCATSRSHLRATYRNFFAPHARWQFTGLRLAADA